MCETATSLQGNLSVTLNFLSVILLAWLAHRRREADRRERQDLRARATDNASMREAVAEIRQAQEDCSEDRS